MLGGDARRIEGRLAAAHHVGDDAIALTMHDTEREGIVADPPRRR